VSDPAVLELYSDRWSLLLPSLLSCLLSFFEQMQSRQVAIMHNWRKRRAAPVAIITGKVVHTISPEPSGGGPSRNTKAKKGKSDDTSIVFIW